MRKKTQQSLKKEKLSERRNQLEQEIEHLASPGGANDFRLKGLADTLGGSYCCLRFMTISPLMMRPYFSAMYGPARHAIVVSHLDGIKEKLADLDDCPEDLYLIEGDVDAFDDSSFNADELEGAVCVQLNDRQIALFPVSLRSLCSDGLRVSSAWNCCEKSERKW